MLALVLLAPGCLILPRQDRNGVKALEAGDDLVGAWLGAWPSDEAPLIEEFEERTNVELDLVDVYLDWFTPFGNVSHTLDHIARRGAIPILSWEAQTLTTRDLIQGTKQLPMRDGSRVAIDDYLESFSAGTCEVSQRLKTPIFVRVLHEMNGHWFAWGISYQRENGDRPNTDASYREAWVKIHDAFSEKCGDQVRFVWAINHFSVGEGASFMGAYPGDAYVDYVGIDGYNWGTKARWGWQSFEELFTPAYCDVVAGTGKPILVAETASTERGGDKAEWIRDLFASLRHYPQMNGLIWFNDAKYEIEIRGSMDWPIDSSEEATAAFSEGAQALLDVRSEGVDGGADPAGAAVVRC